MTVVFVWGSYINMSCSHTWLILIFKLDKQVSPQISIEISFWLNLRRGAGSAIAKSCVTLLYIYNTWFEQLLTSLRSFETWRVASSSEWAADWFGFQVILMGCFTKSEILQRKLSWKMKNENGIKGINILHCRSEAMIIIYTTCTIAGEPPVVAYQ